MKTSYIFIIAFGITSSIFGFELAQKTTRKRALEKKVNQDHFSLSLPTVPNVLKQDVESYCFQMSSMEEKSCSCFWSKAMDRELANLEYKDDQLKPIMHRYVEAIISWAHKENVPVQEAKATIQKDMGKLGYIIYGQVRRTSPSKWNLVRKKLFAEIGSDRGFELQMPRKYKRLG